MINEKQKMFVKHQNETQWNKEVVFFFYTLIIAKSEYASFVVWFQHSRV